MKYGFIEDKIKDTDYILGGFQIPVNVLQEDGSWLDYLPIRERQLKQGVETQSCVTFATLNVVEILIKRLFDKEENYSDRYLSIASETTPVGNSPSKVADTLRKVSGCINEDLLPFSEDIKTWEDYYSPKPLPENLKRKGKKWLSKYSFKYERVFRGGTLKEKQEKLKEGLFYSPLGVSVYAWAERNGMYYKPEGVRDTHYVVLVGYKQGEYWLVFDSYPASDGIFLKKLEWDFDFGMAKRYFIEKQSVKKNWWRRFINFLKRWL